jgi:hypothetical protein
MYSDPIIPELVGEHGAELDLALNLQQAKGSPLGGVSCVSI